MIYMLCTQSTGGGRVDFRVVHVNVLFFFGGGETSCWGNCKKERSKNVEKTVFKREKFGQFLIELHRISGLFDIRYPARKNCSKLKLKDK